MARITSEKNVTVDDLLREAKVMWKKARGGASLESIHKEHPMFCQAYAIVARCMCDNHMYSSRAFREYIQRIVRTPYRSIEQFLDYQSDFMRDTMKYLNKSHPNMDSLNAYRNEVRKTLQKEHDEFMRAGNAAQHVIDDTFHARSKGRKDGLRDILRDAAAKKQEDVPIVVQAEHLAPSSVAQVAEVPTLPLSSNALLDD